ncbi:MAG: glycine-rich domain-containing protein [Candidatus Moraniibacteriota bacterium]
MKNNIFKKMLSFLTVCTLVLSMVGNAQIVQAAPSTFNQTDWTTGQSVNTANNTSNQTGWSEFSSSDAKILNTTDIQLNNVYSANIDFNTEADYIQENATDGTDFDGGMVELHGSSLVATGGTITTVGDYKVHEFSSAGTFEVTAPGDVDFLVVAGGGGGAAGDDSRGGSGGGGAGGVVYEQNQNILNGSHLVSVGNGGNGGWNGVNGVDSVFYGSTALGGGRAVFGAAGGAGGSGGGGSRYGNIGGVGEQPSSVSGGFGSNGGRAYNNGTREVGAGGGGGAGGVGGAAYSTYWGGPGGTGVDYSSVFGIDVGENGWFASGGGGGGHGVRPGIAPIGGGGDEDLI